MARRLINMTETFAEKQARIRRETANRMRWLATIAVLTIAARVIIKDPVKAPPPDHSGVPIKIMPGLLDSLPPAERVKLAPEVLAQLMAADEKAKLDRALAMHPKKPTELAYAPQHRPEAADATGELAKQAKFQTMRRRHVADTVHRKLQEETDAPKKAMVTFARGGTLRVNDVRRNGDRFTLRLTGVSATVPDTMVRSVSTDPKDWKETVPPGMVQLRPAPGITIIVGREAAGRITVEKNTYDEI